MTERTLPELIGSKILVVAAHYFREETTRVYVCGALVRFDNSLSLIMPRGHQLEQEDRITLHLDNRTGVSEYDEELSVFRLSYKGVVTSIDSNRVEVKPLEFQVFYGIRPVLEFIADNYHYPSDYREDAVIPESPLELPPPIDQSEHNNKVGVLITEAISQPHTTVMAFLSSQQDDIFMITFPNSFKSQVLKRNNHCYFAIDNRATYAFEEAIEWNYSIIEAEAYKISRERELFSAIQELFILKNPWEAGFFGRPDVEMFHLKPKSVVCPTKAVGAL